LKLIYPQSHLSTNNYAKSEGVNSMADDHEGQDLRSLTTEIVASFVGNHTVAVGDLPAVIASVFGALRSAAQPEAEQPATAPVPAVPVKKSIGTDYLICLEDGR
jgi:predicted transcriptional regulator